MSKNLEHYMALPYSMEVKLDSVDNLFVARVRELPGCSGHGESPESAISMLRGNMEEWIALCIETGVAIPEPAVDADLPSGKWLQRVPKSLHANLIKLTLEEDTSLNQLVVSILSQYVGHQAAKFDLAAPKQPDSPQVLDPWAAVFEIYGAAEWSVELTAGSNANLDLALLDNLVKSAPTNRELNLKAIHMAIKVSTATGTEASYKKFLANVELFALGLDSVHAELKRSEYAELWQRSRPRPTNQITSTFEISEFDADHFDIAAKLEVHVCDDASEPLLRINVEYSGHFHPKVGKFQRTHASRFAEVEARLIFWPYFRQTVSDLTARMHIRPLTVPLNL